MVDELIQTVKTWEPTKQPFEANEVVAIVVRNMALHLWNEHQKLDFAIQITNALIGIFKYVNGMEDINRRLNEDIATLYSIDMQREIIIEQQRKSGGDGCLPIVIFGILGLIGALLQGC